MVKCGGYETNKTEYVKEHHKEGSTEVEAHEERDKLFPVHPTTYSNNFLHSQNFQSRWVYHQ